MYTEKIVNAIREDIILGKYEPGERLPETRLSTLYKTSRSPVREALQKLASEGLVVIYPRRGAWVKSFHADGIRELFEVREAIDGMAARGAATRADPIQIQKLVDTLHMTKSLLEKDDIPTYPLDLDFHLKILEGSRNTNLFTMGCEIHTKLRIARSMSGFKSGRALSAYDEHCSILDAIKARDPNRAEIAMRVHVRNALASVLPILRRKRK